MKHFVLGSLILLLFGCASVKAPLDKVKSMIPRKHDSALVAGFIDLDVSLEKIDCVDKSNFEEAVMDAQWLHRYALFKKDPQIESTEAIMVNLEKAETASEGACNRWLNLSKTRMDVLRQAWSTRW